jgi:hypothetical protein
MIDWLIGQIINILSGLPVSVRMVPASVIPCAVLSSSDIIYSASGSSACGHLVFYR